MAILHWIFLLPAFAAVSGWVPITSKAKPSCVEGQACKLRPSAQAEWFSLAFQFDTNESRKTLRRLDIVNLKTNEESQYYVEGMEELPQSSPIKFFKADFNSDGNMDLVLYANGEEAGTPVYYYFLFDEKSRGFIMTESARPQLRVVAPGRLETSDGEKYFVNSQLRVQRRD